MSERAIVFIDGSNFYFGLKRFCRKTSPFDFVEFARRCCGQRELKRIYYHTAPEHQQCDPRGYKEQRSFFSHLRNSGVEIVLGRLEDRKLRLDKDELIRLLGEDLGNMVYEQKGEIVVSYHRTKSVDTGIAVNMLDFAVDEEYDVAILVTGDGDFDSPIEAVKRRGKQVEVAFFKSFFPRALRPVCDACIYVDDFIWDCFIR